MFIDDYMYEAINMARIAYNSDEVPVGAVIVKDERIIGRGSNRVISDQSVVSHAEINAINDACKNLENYRLKNCEIYITLEPCHMCTKAIVDARINHIYFGAAEPKTGAIHSIDTFLEKDHLNHKVSFSGGHMEALSTKLLRDFFQARRP